MTPSASPLAPTVARVTSLNHWITFFHPTKGIFRTPHIEGLSIEHLEIDLRYINHEYDNISELDHGILPQSRDIYLPNVCIVTLRGAEHVHDSEERMDALAEVLLALKPLEVRWLNADNDYDEQITLSTHLVHPAIIAAGEIWAREGGLAKVVIQGGFPCPNLTAPTPYSLTPAATPCPSPGPTKTSFGTISALPALSLTKPKPLDEAKVAERAERKRVADYSLKPRFEFAMGSWGAEHIEWRFDGRYTPACIRAAIELLLKALDKTFPYASTKTDARLPSLLTFAPLPTDSIDRIRDLVLSLELDSEVVAYLSDVVFFAISPESSQYARLFENTGEVALEDDPRQACRLRAEMLLVTGNKSILPYSDLLDNSHADINALMSESTSSLMPGETDASTDDENEAVTPEIGVSMLSIPLGQVKGQEQGQISPGIAI